MPRMLSYENSVEELTSLKLELLDKCQRYENFPKGNPYLRRKSKGNSSYSSLEERLSSDICELLTFLDNKVVTTKIKAMLKAGNTSVTCDDENNPLHGLTFVAPALAVGPSPLRESGWSVVKSKIASFESMFLIYKEKADRAGIIDLVNKVKNLTAAVNEQKKEIDQLKSKSQQLQEMRIGIDALGKSNATELQSKRSN